jgi:hypothetical protein
MLSCLHKRCTPHPEAHAYGAKSASKDCAPARCTLVSIRDLTDVVIPDRPPPAPAPSSSPVVAKVDAKADVAAKGEGVQLTKETPGSVSAAGPLSHDTDTDGGGGGVAPADTDGGGGGGDGVAPAGGGDGVAPADGAMEADGEPAAAVGGSAAEIPAAGVVGPGDQDGEQDGGVGATTV